ncbi:hypothetical protein ACO1DI_12395 [Priestia sp. 40]|uniref:hypothetical protein n=1 Tax=Priestia sp. 40 TaxID=3394459 RepID=UPI003BF74932
MTNYIEDILTKDEEKIYTVNVPKDVESIKVHANVSPHIIEGLKEQFPYEGNLNVYDHVNGIIRLHKTPQNEWDKREQHLNEAKRHVKIANEMVPYAYTSYNSLLDDYNDKKEIESVTKNDSELTITDYVCMTTALIGVVWAIVWGIVSLIKLFA